MRVKFRVFESGLKTWRDLFQEAALFATQVGRDRLITISHSEDHNDGTVTVWYWAEERAETPQYGGSFEVIDDTEKSQ